MDGPKKIAVLIKGSIEGKPFLEDVIKHLHEKVDPQNLWVIAGRHRHYTCNKAEEFQGKYPSLQFESMAENSFVKVPKVYFAEGDFSPAITPTNGLVFPYNHDSSHPHLETLWRSAKQFFLRQDIYTIGVGLPGLGQDGSTVMPYVAYVGEGEAIIFDPRDWESENIFSRSMPAMDYKAMSEVWKIFGEEGVEHPNKVDIINSLELPKQMLKKEFENPLDSSFGLMERVTLAKPEFIGTTVAKHVNSYRSRE